MRGVRVLFGTGDWSQAKPARSVTVSVARYSAPAERKTLSRQRSSVTEGARPLAKLTVRSRKRDQFVHSIPAITVQRESIRWVMPRFNISGVVSLAVAPVF